MQTDLLARGGRLWPAVTRNHISSHPPTLIGPASPRPRIGHDRSSLGLPARAAIGQGNETDPTMSAGSGLMVRGADRPCSDCGDDPCPRTSTLPGADGGAAPVSLYRLRLLPGSPWRGGPRCGRNPRRSVDQGSALGAGSGPGHEGLRLPTAVAAFGQPQRRPASVVRDLILAQQRFSGDEANVLLTQDLCAGGGDRAVSPACLLGRRVLETVSPVKPALPAMALLTQPAWSVLSVATSVGSRAQADSPVHRGGVRVRRHSPAANGWCPMPPVRGPRASTRWSHGGPCDPGQVSNRRSIGQGSHPDRAWWSSPPCGLTRPW